MATTTWTDSNLSAGAAVYSTHLASKIFGYEELADRICLDLGAPLINLEIHGKQIYTNIARAVEMYSKFAGYTEEYLVVDSELYERGKGLNLERAIANTPELTATYSTTVHSSLVTTNTVATLSTVSFSANSQNTYILKV